MRLDWFSFLPTRKYCCEIGCIITNTAGGEYGDLVFSAQNMALGTDVAIERMRMTSNCNVGIGTNDPKHYYTLQEKQF